VMDEDRFIELEGEIQVLFVEIGGYIDEGNMKKAGACLKEVDEKVSLIDYTRDKRQMTDDGRFL
jgi:hypothetical protein